MIALFDKLILVHKPGLFTVIFVVLSCKICKSSVFFNTSSGLKDGGFFICVVVPGTCFWSWDRKTSRRNFPAAI